MSTATARSIDVICMARRRRSAAWIYDLTAVAYALTPDFISSHASFDGRVRSAIVPRERGVDIDDRIDLLVANSLCDEKAK